MPLLSVGSVAAVRRLLPLVAVLVFVDTMLFAALTPLLPHFADELGLSKTRAGALVAAYAAGALIGRAAIFCALAGLALVLIAWTLRLESAPPGEEPSRAALARAFRNRQFT